MAAGIGQEIEAVDYRAIRDIMSAVFGIGGTNPETGLPDPTFGYGQVLSSSTVNPGDVITASQWSQLRTDMSKSRQHQTGIGVKSDNAMDGNSLLVPEVGGVITNEMLEQHLLFVYNLIENKFDIAPNQSSVEAPSPGVVQFTGPWRDRLEHEITITGSTTVINPLVPSANTAKENLRFFFNAGGKIKLSANRIGGSASTKNSSWTSLLCSMGEIIFGPNSTVSSNSITGSSVGSTPVDPIATASCSIGPGSAGPGLETNIGWNDLTTTYQLVYQKYAEAGVYVQNNYQVYAKTNADKSELKFKVVFDDASVSTNSIYSAYYLYDEVVDGTIISGVSYIRPSGPNVSVPGPNIVLGAISLVEPVLPTLLAATQNQGTGTLTIPKPSGIQVGGLIIAFLTTTNSSGTWTTPSGWTKSRQQTSQPYVCVMYKVATSADLSTSSYNFLFSSSGTTAGVLIASNNAQLGTVGKIRAGANGTLTAPSTYASSSDSILLSFFVGGTGQSISTPAGMTVVSGASRSSAPSFNVFRQDVPAGTTGSRSISLTGANSGAVLVTISGKIP
jgi:hypothetical protein